MSFHESTFTRFVVNHLARLFAMALDAQICPLGLTLGQLPILLELWERDGLIRRTVHPKDARAQQIWLTDQARALREPAYQAADTVNTQALAKLTGAEREAFLTLAGRLIHALDPD